MRDCNILTELQIALWSKWKVCESEMLRKYKRLILMTIEMKTKQKIIRSGHIFQIIHAEY